MTTRMIKELGKLRYEESLKRCQLTTHEKSSRGDLIEAFKILLGMEELLPQQFSQWYKKCFYYRERL